MRVCYEHDGDAHTDPHLTIPRRWVIPPHFSLKAREHTGELRLGSFVEEEAYFSSALMPYEPDGPPPVKRIITQGLIIPGRHFQAMVFLLRIFNWMDRIRRLWRG